MWRTFIPIWKVPITMRSKAESLRSLHRPGNPVVLPNAWDASSAQTLVEAGFGAVATSSSAVASALGYADGERTPLDEMLKAVGRIARAVDAPVTADIERGYGLGPRDIIDRLIDSGAVGCNLEDSDPSSSELVAAERQADWLGEIRAAATEAGVPVVLNARIDVYIREWGQQDERFGEAVRRGRLYLDAGADCVYPIFLADRDELKRFAEQVGGPVNALYSGSMSLGEMASIRMARVTFGSGLHGLTQSWLSRIGARIREGLDPYST